MRDTIVAISTARGGGGRGVIRVSGPAAFSIVGALYFDRQGSVGLPHRPGPHRGWMVVDRAGSAAPADCWCFVAPRSYTGDDLVECHLPGAPFLLDQVVRRLCAGGARPATPGEFTQRAVLAGKLDLTRAEATLALIRARDEGEHRRARALLEGGLARMAATLQDRLIELLVPLELALDFSDQDVALIQTAGHAERIDILAEDLRRLAESERTGARRDLPRVVLRGPANAGKSSLFNALLGRDAALTTPVPGTTRDIVAAECDVGGRRVWLVDTAGDDVFGTVLDDLAHAARERAVLEADLVIEARAPGQEPWPSDAGAIPVLTMADLPPTDANLPPGVLRTSSLTREGLDRLAAEVVRRLDREPAGAEPFLVTARHGEHLRAAALALDRAGLVIGTASPEFAASDLRAALREISAILGTDASDPVLDRIFRDFCIGK